MVEQGDSSNPNNAEKNLNFATKNSIEEKVVKETSLASVAKPGAERKTGLAVSGVNKTIMYTFVGLSVLFMLTGVCLLFRKKQAFKH